MAWIFNKLNDPQLVANFQRYCGVIPGVKTVNTTSFSNHTDETTCTNSVGDGMQNGTTSNLRHRRNESDFTAESSDQKTEGSSSDEDASEKEYTITNRFFYYIFHFAANLGNEIFYITFFPFWFWNIDGYVGRRVAVFWCAFMYLGQATKDIVRWPRPKSPPVIHMEKRYALEYGMPSTHAMVGAGMPFSILYCANAS